MKHKLATLILALGLFPLAACNDDSDDGKVIVQNPEGTKPTVGPVPDTSVALVGTSFETNCLRKGVLDLTSSTRTFSFQTGGGFEKREVYFLGDDCGVAPYLRYRVVGTMTDRGQDPAHPGIYQADFTVQDAFLTVTNENQRITFNTGAFCGKTDWTLDQEVSIGGLNCEGFTIRSGDVIPEVYAKEDKTLYFGEAFVLLLNASVRPTGLDRDVPYSQINP